MANILLISQNAILAQDIKEQLQLYAKDFVVYDEIEDEVVFELVVVDEQIDVLPIIQSKMLKTPIILLLADPNSFDSATDAVKIVYKPMRLEEFLDVVNASINLFANSSSGLLVFNRYQLNTINKEICNLRNNEIIKLTEREVSILKYLYKAQDKIVSKSELLSEVWGYNPEASTHTVETHIYRLRQKIEHEDNDFQIIVTEENGYKLLAN